MVVFLDEECLELMKKQNTFLVPTLCAPQCIIDKGIENGVAKYAVTKTLKVKDAHVESVKKSLRKRYSDCTRYRCRYTI